MKSIKWTNPDFFKLVRFSGNKQYARLLEEATGNLKENENTDTDSISFLLNPHSSQGGTKTNSTTTPRSKESVTIGDLKKNPQSFQRQDGGEKMHVSS